MTKLSIECQRIHDCNRVRVWCMLVIKGSCVEARIDFPLEKIVLLKQLMEMVANARATS